eukprot:TRINITY_DN22_c0_g1_i1.p1 TRINITY_DN22_c0_g1~~TRINITY_DN22_c0_g1_i1.p1  ORF type:complete len:231 (-),score=61.88 TRINITY_DN22_c0_g1_i1:354-1046(-)
MGNDTSVPENNRTVGPPRPQTESDLFWKGEENAARSWNSEPSLRARKFKSYNTDRYESDTFVNDSNPPSSFSSSLAFKSNYEEIADDPNSAPNLISLHLTKKEEEEAIKRAYEESLEGPPQLSADGQYYIHRVTGRETLQGLALKYGVQVDVLKKVNRIWRTDDIFARKELLIPATAEKQNLRNLTDSEKKNKFSSTIHKKSEDDEEIQDEDRESEKKNHAKLEDEMYGL